MESCSFLQAILLMLPPTELPSRSLMGFCYLSPLLERVKATHKHFSTRPTAIFIASFPKTGTTWLKCLLFSIASNHQKETPVPESFTSLATRDTFIALWDFIQHESAELNSFKFLSAEALSFEEPFEKFCEGKLSYGPFLEHISEYCSVSKDRPDKVLFLTYEQMKADPKGGVKKIAEFIGQSIEEEEEVKKIVKMCSFEA
ncbi:hypothetical protein AMTR_s00062p00027880 [Amborella trichopoda]|uniref:Sulfotransferase n=1 Tax=Amborella trichopoda TaxID=13333 RepID=U5DGG8_AMBTC|nr:hypothetical protein AMTR_s00062p00027880 [Amborella trichopoda]